MFSAFAFEGPIAIKLDQITTSTQLHQTLKTELSFPDYYGMNWDAFCDCMRDILENDKVELVFTGNKIFKRNFPREAKLMLEVLRELKQEYPENLFYHIH